MTLEYFDTHSHLFDRRFTSDCDAVIARAFAVGVTRILTLGIDRVTSQTSVEQATKYPSVYAAVGIQPNHVAEASPTDWDAIAALARSGQKIIAIGETGLDRYWDRVPFELQEDYFSRHIALGRELKKPIVIHCREAEADTVKMLRSEFEQHGPIMGILHSYTGDAASAAACVAMGLHVSFAGMLSYPSAANIREVAATIPADRLLIETDCPYLSPIPKRGQRNEPGYVIHTAEVLAQTRGVDVATIAKMTTANARNLFGV